MASQDIKIFNFSNFDQCRKTKAYFRLKNICYFIIEVHPNGIFPNHKKYVSVRILKLPKNARAWSYMNNVHLSWTLSVVDLNGYACCSRSFVIENVAQFSNEDILDFQKRSHLLSRADELSPKDVLTIRCELFEISMSVHELLVPITKEENASDVMNPLGISNMDTARKRGKVRIASEMHKIYSSIMNLIIELSCVFTKGEFRQEEIRSMLANYDALDEIRQTYLSSVLKFRMYLQLKEKLREAKNDEIKKNWIDGFLSAIFLESKSDGERQRITQMTPEPPKDEGKCFSKSASHKDGESERTTETDQPFNFGKNLGIAIINCLGNVSKMPTYSLDRISDENTDNAYDEEECKRETVRQDCSLSQKDRERERVTENVQSFGFDIFQLKESFNDGNEIIQYITKENFDTSNENAFGEQDCKREATTEMNSGPSHDQFQFLPAIVGQECLISHKDGESEKTTETHQLSHLEINNRLKKCFESVQPFLTEVELLSETHYEKTESGRKKTTQITSRPTKDEATRLIRFFQQICGEFLEISKGENTHPVSESFSNTQYGECQRTIEIVQPSEVTMNMVSELEKFNEKCAKLNKRIFENCFGIIEQNYTADNQATWNLYLETMDGITFTIPFEDGRETLGLKLISYSKVFQEMLELNPKRETLEEKVKLKDEDCDTFINFLSFLQKKDIEVETLPELISLYNLADKYDVQELMLLCAERMQPLFSPSNIDEIEEFACLHYDEHFLELVQLYKEKHIHPVSEQNEDTETLTNENSASLDEQTKERECNFEFYQ